MPDATLSPLDDLQAQAARAAAIVTELQSLGFSVIDRQEMTDAAERSVPLLRGLARAQMIVAECAAAASKENLPAGEVLAEAARLIGLVVGLVESKQFVGLVLGDGASPAGACVATPSGQ